MKPNYSMKFDISKRENRIRFTARAILWAVALIVILAVVGGGAFGADGAKPEPAPTNLIVAVLLSAVGVGLVIGYCIYSAAKLDFRNHWTNRQFDDTRDWIVASERKPRAADPLQHAPEADLTLASASAAHDSQGFATGGVIPKDFYVTHLGQAFNPEKYLNKDLGRTESAIGEDGLCRHCGAVPLERHRPGCSVLAMEAQRMPRPCRAHDIPEAHELLSNHVNEIDTIIGNQDHFDDLSIDAFAEAIKYEMRVAREQKGRSGWWDSDKFTDSQLELALKLVMRKGDVVSIGAYAMMLHQRGITHLKS